MALIQQEVESNLDLLHREIDSCRICRSGGYGIAKPVSMFRGTMDAKLMAIGIAPGNAAIQAAKAFAGNSMSRLLSWFNLAGFAMSEEECRQVVYFTSLNKCGSIPDSPSNRRKLWGNCNQFLWRQIDLLKPPLILVLGQEPAEILMGKAIPRLNLNPGAVAVTGEIFSGELFPSTRLDARWLVLPHPSGLSRSMNNASTSSRVIDSLRRELLQINF